MAVLKMVLIYGGIWLAISLIQFAAYMVAAKIIRNETPPVIFLAVALAGSLFLLLPCIGYILFPFVLLYLLCKVAHLELWPPALLIAIIGTFLSTLVFNLLKYITVNHIFPDFFAKYNL